MQDVNITEQGALGKFKHCSVLSFFFTPKLPDMITNNDISSLDIMPNYSTLFTRKCIETRRESCMYL